MAYTRTDWVSGETPLSAENMNNIEDGIEECQSDISDLNSKTQYSTSETITVASGVTKVVFSMHRFGKIVIIRFQFHLTSAKANQDIIFSNIPNDFKPITYFHSAVVNTNNHLPYCVSANPDGTIRAAGPLAAENWYSGEIVFITN